MQKEVLYISDACILIDLFEVGLLDGWLKLKTCCTTNLVYAEIMREANQNRICADAIEACCADDLLEVVSLDFQQIVQVNELAQTRKRLSEADASTFVITIDRSGTLLTADSGLRKLCKQRAVPVHGLIYILDELLEAEQISKTIATRCIKEWARINNRVPRDIVTDRLKQWL